MSMTPSQRELEQLIQDSFHGELAEADAARLRALLRESPAAADTYCSYAILESELHRYANHRNLSSRPTAPFPSPRRQALTSLAAAAAILTLGAIVLSWIWTKPPESVVRSFALSSGTVATNADGNPLMEDGLTPGQTVSLTQGAVHLTLRTGTEAVIDAPSVFTLTDLNNLHLKSGRGWFRVPAAGLGFQVHTSTARIIDLGTEFGVASRDKSPTELHVFQGKVVASALVGRRDDIILSSGQAGTSTAVGQWTRATADPAAFKRSLPSELPFVHLSFDGLEHGRVPVTSTIANNLPVTATLHGPEEGPAPTLVPGVRGTALRLRGDGSWLSTDWPGIDGQGPVTVSTWIQLAPGTDLGQAAPALALWGNPSAGWDAKFKLAVCALNHERPVARVSLGDWRVDGATPLDDGQWHHLTVVYRGVRNNADPVVELYLDGHREPLTLVEDAAATRISIETHSPGSLPLELGRYELSQHSTVSLDAAIDELRITAGALTADQVRTLANPHHAE